MVSPKEVLGYDFGGGRHFLVCSDRTKFPKEPNSNYTLEQAAEWVANKEARYHGFENTSTVFLRNRAARTSVKIDPFIERLSSLFLVADKKAIFVPYHGTTKQCSLCLSWNTKRSSYYDIDCLDCGMWELRDLNSSQNIARLAIEKINYGYPYPELVNFFRDYRKTAETIPLSSSEISMMNGIRDKKIPQFVLAFARSSAGWIGPHGNGKDWVFLPPPLVSLKEALQTIADGFHGREAFPENTLPERYLTRLASQGKILSKPKLYGRLLKFGYKYDSNILAYMKNNGWKLYVHSRRRNVKHASYFFPPPYR